MPFPVIVHGSEDSIDKDVFFITDKKIFDPNRFNKQEVKELCDRLSHDENVNGNLVSVDNGVVTHCYKGTVDEVNNGMLYTYHLHDQEHQLPVIKKLPRDADMKLLRTTRGILSMFSRTDMRAEVKAALRSDKISDKIDVLKKIDFEKKYDFSAKGTDEDIYKFFAFQFCQTNALLQGKEIFTKSQAAFYDPRLRPFLYRDQGHRFYHLNDHLNDIIRELQICSTINNTHIKTQFGLLSVKDEAYVKGLL